MSISININAKVLSELNALIDEREDENDRHQGKRSPKKF
jgi:hypothetical protein